MSIFTASLAVALLAPTSATLGPNGTVRLTRNGQTLATIGPTVARTGWSFVGFVPGTEPGSIYANIPGGRLEGKVSLSSEAGNQARYVFEATPTVDLGIETSGIALSFTPDWAGATYSTHTVPFGLGGSGEARQGTFPMTFKETALFTGKIGTLSVQSGSKRVSLGLTEQGQALFQDSRGFGGGFDLRLGIPAGSETWPKGQTRRYTAIIGTGEPMDILETKPLTIVAGPDWIPLEAHLDVEAGSVLDWSPKKVEPAGAHGWVQARNGHFVFEKEPAKPVRFYGANLAFSAAMPDPPVAAVLAERLKRLGYNTIRLHHFDMELSGGTWDGERTGSSTSLAADPIDRMDRLVAEMKKRGIYTTLDFYTIRRIAKDEVIPGYVAMDEYKALTLVSEKARENWWAFTKAILEHVNPYTGLKWKDDPAIAWLVVVNEGSVGNAIRAAGPITKRLFDEAWRKAGHTGDFDYNTDEGARFGATLHQATYQWMKAKIRSIGSKALLSDVNGWHEQTTLVPVREALDYVDNHDYWDHPTFLGADWGLPSRGWSGGGMASAANAGGLANKALSRVKGLPFTISEFNFVAPNRYRSEAGLLMGSLAARQGWDAMWRFAWSHTQDSIKQPGAIAYFDVQSDPIMLSTERAIISLFLREDMEVAKPEGVVRFDAKTANSRGYSAPVTDQIFDVRVASSSRAGDPSGAKVAVPSGPSPIVIRRDEGEIVVNTPRTAGIFAETGKAVVAGPLTATLSGHRAALWVSSTDGIELRSSKRILLTHLTDAQNSGVRFAGEDRDVIQAWGTQPWLIRRGGASVQLTVSDPKKASVYRLDMAGKRVEKLPVKVEQGALTFEVSVQGPKGATLYYEIVK